MIDTTAININFPAAGQNNSSQGFRDNFAAIKTGLDITSQYLGIVDVLSKTVLIKDEKNGSSLLNNDMDYHFISRPTLKAPGGEYINNGISGEVLTVDYYRGNLQRFSISTDVRISFINFPTDTIFGTVKIWITNNVDAHNLFLPDNVRLSQDSPYYSTKIVPMTTTGDYLFEFIKIDSDNAIWMIDQSKTPIPIASYDKAGMVRIDGVSLEVDSTGLLTVRSGSPSDIRLKNNIATLQDPLGIIRKLRGVTFNWIDGNLPSLGVIAQELESVLPELVSTDTNGMKQVDYSKLAAVFIESIKQLDLRTGTS